MFDSLLRATNILDYEHPAIKGLISRRGWQQLPDHEKIGAAYDYVRDEVKFGYNKSDDLKASEVLREGIGQCNTKANLLMALLRALGIPCRLHGFTIDKKLQKGAVTGVFYLVSPKSIIHSWVEIYYGKNWINLEGFILDKPYLSKLQKKFHAANEPFCGYGVAISDFKSPPIEWRGTDTYIQKDGINRDLGIFETPDEFYEKMGTNLRGLKRLLFVTIVRRIMTDNVSRIRDGK
ncbi:MAG: transglutaminase-like domain-containing protein [Bradyrhizobium sp.]|uniref:transglutaminase-like domain-containing protein n=1 Tax=Bradyrhizobium sp. TaxID=376 RepID=UPI003BF10986